MSNDPALYAFHMTDMHVKSIYIGGRIANMQLLIPCLYIICARDIIVSEINKQIRPPKEVAMTQL